MFVNDCRVAIKLKEGSIKPSIENLNQERSVICYYNGYITAREESVTYYAINKKMSEDGKSHGIFGDLKPYEKELYGYVIPKNMTHYILSKLIVNYVDSDPRALGKSPRVIVSNVLRKAYESNNRTNGF
tara:strand:+ start:829 stop:1215 length:387 start_codon:yes stop_codon:yes gene_type:complete